MVEEPYFDISREQLHGLRLESTGAVMRAKLEDGTGIRGLVNDPRSIQVTVYCLVRGMMPEGAISGVMSKIGLSSQDITVLRCDARRVQMPERAHSRKHSE